jgi:hypothetical protein
MAANGVAMIFRGHQHSGRYLDMLNAFRGVFHPWLNRLLTSLLSFGKLLDKPEQHNQETPPAFGLLQLAPSSAAWQLQACDAHNAREQKCAKDVPFGSGDGARATVFNNFTAHEEASREALPSRSEQVQLRPPQSPSQQSMMGEPPLVQQMPLISQHTMEREPPLLIKQSEPLQVKQMPLTPRIRGLNPPRRHQ